MHCAQHPRRGATFDCGDCGESYCTDCVSDGVCFLCAGGGGVATQAKPSEGKGKRFFMFGSLYVVACASLCVLAGVWVVGGRSHVYSKDSHGETVVFKTPMVYASNWKAGVACDEDQKYNRYLMRAADSEVPYDSHYKSGKKELSKIRDGMQFKVIKSYEEIPWGLMKPSSGHRTLVLRDEDGLVSIIGDFLVEPAEIDDDPSVVKNNHWKGALERANRGIADCEEAAQDPRTGASHVEHIGKRYEQRGRLRVSMGDLDLAQDDLLKAIELGDEYASFFLAGLVRKRPQQQTLEVLAKGDDWRSKIAKFSLRELSSEALLAEARKADSDKQRDQQLCEAHGYIAMQLELDKSPQEAKKHYEACVATGVTNYTEYIWAKQRLSSKP